VAGHVAPALASLFTRLNPLFATFGDQLVHGSAALEHWAKTSDSVGKFVAYVQTSLPAVEQTFGSLATTASHVVMGLEPFGGGVLTTLRVFSQAINAIPIGVLQTLLPLLAGLKIGASLTASISNASVGLAGLAKNLGTGSRVAEGAAGVVGKFGKAVGFLGPVGLAAGLALGGLSVVMGRGKQSAIEDTKRVNDLTQAIQNQTTATTVLSQLQESGAVKAGKDLGLTQQTLVQSVIQHGAALDQVKAKIASANAQYQIQNNWLDQSRNLQSGDTAAINQAVAARDRLGNQLRTLSGGLQQEIADYNKAKDAVATWAREQGDASLAAAVASGAYLDSAKKLGVTGDAYINAKLAADKNTQSVQANTTAMVLENNAVGLLSQALQGLGGNNLGVAQATTSLRGSTAAATKTLHDNGRTLDQNTAKGRTNAQALQQQASDAISLAKAVEQQTGSTRKGNASLADSKTRLEAALRSQHMLTPAIQTYINTLYKIPARKVTNLDLRDAAARAKAIAYKAWIQSLNPILTITSHIQGPGQGGGAGKLASRDVGGPVVKGTPYVIGLNRRPEIFVPEQSGQIVPISSGSKAPMVAAGGGGTTINLTVNAGLGTDGPAVGRQIIGIIERAFAAGETVAGGQRAMR